MYNTINFENSNYNIVFKDIQYEISIIDPFIELKRYQLIQEIKNKIKIIFNNYKLNIDVNNILPRFIMVQYKDKSYYVDPIIPYNPNNYTQLKKDLYYLSNKKLKNNEIDKLINELDLTNKFNNAVDKLRKYIIVYTNNINKYNYNIKIEDSDDFMYIDFNVENQDEYFYNSLNLNKFKLHKSLYNKLVENYIYKKNDNNFKKLLVCLLLRYNTLESYNQQLSINPEFKNIIKKKYKINFELFASSINCTYNNYCSFFYDIEKNFNSKGYFSNIELKKGFYVSNPPFDEEIMKKMSLKFVESLKDKKNEELSVLITIPYWLNSDYGDYESYKILKDSGLITYEKEIEKEDSIFFDYYKNKYIRPCKIFLIIIQNEKGKKKHKIDNEFNYLVNKYFSKKYFNELQDGGKNDEEINDLLLLELENNKDINFNVNIKIKDYPPEYKLKIAKEFYLSRAKFYYNDIFNLKTRTRNMVIKKQKVIFKKDIPNPIHEYINYILDSIIKDVNIDNLSIIDISYNCEDFKFIEERSRIYYNLILNHLLKNKTFVSTKFNLLFNPLFNLSKKKEKKKFIKNIDYNNIFEKIKNKQDFVIISGSQEHFESKSIFYYLEQCQSLLIFIQLYYLINILKKGGSFIMFCWTLSIELHNEYILFLSKYFSKVYLIKKPNVQGNVNYLVGENFKLLNKSDLNKINKIYDELKEYISESLFGNKLNIKDKKIRKDKYIFKTIYKEHSFNFIHKLFNLEMDKKEKDKLIRKINNFHQKLFEKTMY
tara:strand:- start:1207 stop:3510 length:2304 start_codon:yes stop_codon:yes gene_type:complete